MDCVLRKATLSDREAIAELIADSAKGLSNAHYSEQQIEAAVGSIFGVDTDLIRDKTYFVVESDGMLIACGGWSKRRTLFGGDGYGKRDSGTVDPLREPAKIRAFFVHSAFARRGLARTILSCCEAEAIAEGFREIELLATLPGVSFYRVFGYQGQDRVEHDVNGVKIEFVPMRKVLSTAAENS